MDASSKEIALDAESQGTGNVRYEVRLLAYIDILGWSQLVTKSVESTEEMNRLRVGSRQLSFQSHATAFQREFFKKHNIQIGPFVDSSHFSDTVVMSYPITSNYVIPFTSSIQLLCQSLLVDGHYTRGAVVVGKLYHRDNEIFGPALLEAHDLERNVAKYPRIIVTDEAQVLIDPIVTLPDGSETNFRNILRDHDGLYFIDILGFATGTKNEPRHLTGVEDKVLDQVEAKMSEDIDNLGHRAKHYWMVRYLKQVFADANYDEFD